MALAWMGVGSTKRSFARARSSGSVRPRVKNVFNGKRWMLRRPPTHGVATATGALVFAFPARQWGERVKTDSPGGLNGQSGRDANHAITEFVAYMPWTRPRARACRELPTLVRRAWLGMRHGNACLSSGERGQNGPGGPFPPLHGGRTGPDRALHAWRGLGLLAVHGHDAPVRRRSLALTTRANRDAAVSLGSRSHSIAAIQSQP
jgi:hypothetical protein